MCSCNSNNELYHYGVLGMKWGRTKAPALNRRNASDYKGKGLTVSQASKQAKIDNANAKKQAKLDKKAAKANMTQKEKFKHAVAKGKKVTATVAMASLADDVYYNGNVKKTAKAGVKAAGRAATEAYLYKHGSIEVTWKD